MVMMFRTAIRAQDDENSGCTYNWYRYQMMIVFEYSQDLARQYPN